MNKIDFAERENVYIRAIDNYGITAQLVVAVEELSELQKEICKFLRGNDPTAAIAEEMADVTIMLEQLKIIFANSECVSNFMDTKVKRLKERVEAYAGNRCDSEP